MSKFRSILYLVLSGVVGLLALVCVIALVRALLVQNTLAAIETALGTAVLTLILAVMANKLFKTGWRNLRSDGS